MTYFRRDTMAEASKRHRRRIEAVVEAKGNFFKTIGYTFTSAQSL
jgi:hypothetical protein